MTACQKRPVSERLWATKPRASSDPTRSATRTEIIEPAFAYTFLTHPRSRVDAIVKRTLQAEDVVFKKALEAIEFLDEISTADFVRGLLDQAIAARRETDRAFTTMLKLRLEKRLEAEGKLKQLPERGSAS